MTRSELTPRAGLPVFLGLVSLLSLPACKSPSAPPPPPPGPPAAAAVPAQPKPALLSWRVANAYLEDIFEQIPDSSIDAFRSHIPEAERMRVDAANGPSGLKDDNAYIYGEPSPAATDAILRSLAIQDRDVIYDLGCGRGFFLMQALLTTPARKAVGSELATSRVAIGQVARKKLLEQGLLAPGKELELHDEDLAVTNLDDATIVYMDSVFYSDELLNTVARRMARAGNLRAVVMIMKGLPPNPWFELERTERLKMSWSPKFGSDVLFYRRTRTPAD